MHDIREYGDQELDMIIQNEEPLYKAWNRAISRASYKGVSKAFAEFIENEVEPFILFTHDQLLATEESFELEAAEPENQ